MKCLLFFRKRWRVAGLVLLLLVLATSLWFPRNYHFYFDSHHQYEDATFRQWLSGWFGGFEDGPLYVAIVEGPKIPRGDFTPSTYRWHLERGLPEQRPEIAAWFDEEDGLRFAVVPLEKPREFLVHCWHDGRLESLRYLATARHVGGQPEMIAGTSGQVREDVGQIGWLAFAPTRWRFLRRNASGPRLGDLISLPGEEPTENWVFHFEVSGVEDGKQRSHRNFVLKFEADTDRWEIHDLGEDSASWMAPEKAVDTAFPNGFDPS